MAERTHIPSSSACGEWEMLLADALDGLLTPADEARFAAHQAACPACAALYEEARKGREWLEFLSPEPEPPNGLLERILAHTGPGHQTGSALPVAAGAGTVPAFVPPVWQQPGFFARMRYGVQPRLLMTAAMAFFSIALTLDVTGVRLGSVHVTPIKLADLRPNAVRSYVERQFTTASVPIVRYYDHLKFVYEVESRVRELRGETEDNDAPQRKTTPGETNNWERENKGTREQGKKGTREQDNARPAAEPAGGVLEASLTRVYGSLFGATQVSDAVLSAPLYAPGAPGSGQDERAIFQDGFARSGEPMMSTLERKRRWIA